MRISLPASRRRSTRGCRQGRRKDRSSATRKKRKRSSRSSGESRLGRSVASTQQGAPPQCRAAVHHLSKLQQDASRKLRFSVKRTMMLAQRLYEGVELGEEGAVGLITYMRTDSTRVSDDAMTEVREYIGERVRADSICPEAPTPIKSKKDAQDAHEAIRPTSAMRHPDQVKQYLEEDELKLYRLIWKRFVASQMNPAVFDQTTIDIDAKSGNDAFWFRATGSVSKFDGFLRVYEEAKDRKTRKTRN